MLRVLENPLYYLDNFQDVLHWISARYADLLSPEESRFITAFGALPQPSRALFVRLVMRKGCLFRASKLNYPEIGDTRAAALPLLATGWVEADPVIALDELFDLLLKVEIAQAFDLAPSLKAARKAEQLEVLREQHAENRPFSAWHPASDDVLYRIGLQALCDRLRLIYFGNYHQDWSEFVLSDLGVYQYEKVEFSPESRGFRTRQDIEHYEVLHQCRERYNDSAPADEVLQELAALPLPEDNTWLASRRDKLRFQIAQHLEKSQDWPAAYRAYADCRYPGARGRAIRVLEKDEQPQAAYERLMIALAAPESEAEQQLLLRMAPRLRRKLGHAKLAASAAASVERIDLHLPYPEQACYVEGVVQQHLMRDEAPVYYVENTLINSLFGLLCWPAIFKPMPGAFFHPFHRGPADLHSADFYLRRSPDFAACLALLDDGGYHAAIRATLAAKRGIVSPFVSWDVLDGGLLDLALACIPAAHLKKAFERILLDIKSNRSGFPDLIQFWPAERRYRMIEVKGPGDRLQDNQLRWIAYCAEHAMPVSVCYLQWEGGMKYTIAVRALCEFTAKTGDLDLRFTPSPTAQEGMAGHATVTGRRDDDYQREISLCGDFGPLHVRGRADGYDPARRQLEEIKTYRGELGAMPANHRQLHWAQARIYGHLLCQQLNLPMLRVALVYFDIASQKETLMHEECSAEALRLFFEQHCALFLDWAEQELAHRASRDAQLTAMAFPHADFRPGQRQLAEAMYKASSRGCGLLAQAPTGIGKTVGSLFPMLKATAAHGLDKLFFLAAKVPGRQMALDACAILKESAPLLPLRVLELSAKTSACEHPDKACHGASCPLAKGFYDRLPLAREVALASGLILDKEAVRAVALQQGICPYYLGMELARWSDVVIGDYNYYFDLSAMLYGMTLAHDWKVNVLVDEAHNMVSRARSMYSAELAQIDLKMLRKFAPEGLKKPLDRLSRQWTALLKEQDGDYHVHAALPDKFFGALQGVATAIGDYMAEHAAALDEDLQRFYFDVLLINRLAESFGAHSLFDVSKTDTDSTVCIRNIVPAPFLQERFAASHSTALFSATLSPWNYYSDTLGMPVDTAWVDVESPFQAEQLSVRVADGISTRYQHRAASLLPIAQLMAKQYAQTPGNYLAFFSSFDYMEKTATLFAQHYPDVPIWQQPRRMDDGARAQFLGRFGLDTRGIGFAVLGGAFGEGIDLPGARLIGAFIATLGLPQINPVNEQIRQRMGDLFGAGYDYTYLYPGMQKVVQAAGRVIRTTSDKGVVYLIDDRFSRPEIRQLLPAWWDVQLANQ